MMCIYLRNKHDRLVLSSQENDISDGRKDRSYIKIGTRGCRFLTL